MTKIEEMTEGGCGIGAMAPENVVDVVEPGKLAKESVEVVNGEKSMSIRERIEQRHMRNQKIKRLIEENKTEELEEEEDLPVRYKLQQFSHDNQQSYDPETNEVKFSHEEGGISDYEKKRREKIDIGRKRRLAQSKLDRQRREENNTSTYERSMDMSKALDDQIDEFLYDYIKEHGKLDGVKAPINKIKESMKYDEDNDEEYCEYCFGEGCAACDERCPQCGEWSSHCTCEDEESDINIDEFFDTITGKRDPLLESKLKEGAGSYVKFNLENIRIEGSTLWADHVTLANYDNEVRDENYRGAEGFLVGDIENILQITEPELVTGSDASTSVAMGWSRFTKCPSFEIEVDIETEDDYGTCTMNIIPSEDLENLYLDLWDYSDYDEDEDARYEDVDGMEDYNEDYE